MPNTKKPSEIIGDKLMEIKVGEPVRIGQIIAEMTQILDDQHSQIQSLQKEVEELKKPVNQLCGVRGCNDHFMHAHAQ